MKHERCERTEWVRKAPKRIAVVVATCNGEAYLREQLDSLMCQTLKPSRILIGDDVSNDGTISIIQEYQERYPFIHLQINPERLGTVENFEKLLRSIQQYDYVALCDQDDIWKPEKLEKEFEAMQELETQVPGSACLVHSDLSMIDSAGNPVGDSYFRFRHYRLKAEKDLGHILGPSGVMGNTVFMNRALVEKVLPFPESLEVHDYWIGIVAEIVGSRKTLNEPLVSYRLHGSNVSNRYEILQQDERWWRLLPGFLKGRVRLPYIESSRCQIMQELLKRFDIDQKERRCIDAYMRYLGLRGSRIGNFIDLIRFDLVKRDWRYRVKLLVNLLFNQRYT